MKKVFDIGRKKSMSFRNGFKSHTHFPSLPHCHSSLPKIVLFLVINPLVVILCSVFWQAIRSLRAYDDSDKYVAIKKQKKSRALSQFTMYTHELSLNNSRNTKNKPGQTIINVQQILVDQPWENNNRFHDVNYKVCVCASTRSTV